MSVLYPLRFQPILRRYLWGGRRLETLGKQLPPGDDYAESWEIVDRGADQSVVTDGPLAGTPIHALLREHATALMGKHAGVTQFPLLFKFLDANNRLSIQVHPDDAKAGKLNPPDRGKTEAWVIVAADPGSYLYAGLRPGVDRETLSREVTRRTCELCIELIEPRPGDCFFLPAGVVHALGPGLLVAEIQTPSDTTYRLYDWNRLGPDGRPRPLHVEAALDCINFDYGEVHAQQAQVTSEPGVERLVECREFVLDRWQLSGTRRLASDDRCHLLAVLEGAIAIEGDPAGRPLARGELALVPAECSRTINTGHEPCVVLDAYVP